MILGRDRAVAVLEFLRRSSQEGVASALVTISRVTGSAPRPVGTLMGIRADGRFVGQLSGGCVEPAIAAEVVRLIDAGKDCVLRFGRGSRFVDIQFPCGGGVDLLAHISPDRAVLEQAIANIQSRKPFSLHFYPERNLLRISDGQERADETTPAYFKRQFVPKTRLLAIGRGHELETLAFIAFSAGLAVHVASPDELTLEASALFGASTIWLKSTSWPWDPPIDPWTATAVMFHDHGWEMPILANVAAAGGFYLGALGSARTHQIRKEQLAALSISPHLIDAIRAPIGLIERTREPTALALSVLSEITASRMAFDGANAA